MIYLTQKQSQKKVTHQTRKNIKTSEKMEENIKTSEHVINNVYEMNKKDLAKYYHRCFRRPTLNTRLKAIKNRNFCTWPGLKTELIRKYSK